MKRYYYAAMYYKSRPDELRDVIRFWSYEARKYEVKYAHARGYILKPITRAEAMRMRRELYGLKPYERFYGEFYWMSPNWYDFDYPYNVPEIITHH